MQVPQGTQMPSLYRTVDLQNHRRGTDPRLQVRPDPRPDRRGGKHKVLTATGPTGEGGEVESEMAGPGRPTKLPDHQELQLRGDQGRMIASIILHQSQKGQELLEIIRVQPDLPVNRLQTETDYRVHISNYLGPARRLNSFKSETLARLLTNAVVKSIALRVTFKHVEDQMTYSTLRFLTQFDVTLASEGPKAFY
jgi:hypothetical protein